MPTCYRCGNDLKNLREHMKRVHPQEFWWGKDDPPPHGTAIKVTLDDNRYTLEGYNVKWHEWDPTVSGATWTHGWFIPVEIPYEKPKSIWDDEEDDDES